MFLIIFKENRILVGFYHTTFSLFSYMFIYPKTSKKPRLKVTGVTMQDVCVGMPIIITTEIYVNTNPTSSRQQKSGLI